MVSDSTELAVRPDMGLTFVVTAQEARDRLTQLQQFVRDVMVQGTDYGIIPGTGGKPTLLKPGAEKLLEIYGLASKLAVVNRIENWDGNGFFHYEVACTLTIKGTDIVVATGIGSCNSKEGRYRWREATRKCPNCGSGAIIKGKAEYGGGFICFAKKGGCGAKFRDNDERIVGQQMGRVENDDVFSLVNTILKMAAKRAKIDATLSATRSSALFTQDVEDFLEGDYEVVEDGPRAAAPQRTPSARPQPQQARAAKVVDVPPLPADADEGELLTIYEAGFAQWLEGKDRAKTDGWLVRNYGAEWDKLGVAVKGAALIALQELEQKRAASA